MIVIFYFAIIQSLIASEFKYDGMIDTYYAYNFNHAKKREYTTQPIQHNSASINLAYLGMDLQNKNYRSRVSIQTGDSVKVNTSAEPNEGKSDGFLSPRDFQEAYLGLNLQKNTWIDGGLFLSHIGAESWVSKNNWTYSRALNADQVPYYALGLRLQHQIDAQKSIQVYFINGWNNMTDNNNAKSIAFQYRTEKSDKLTITYNNFFGDEGLIPRFRTYHNLVLQYEVNEKWDLLGSMDLGTQSQQENKGVDTWFVTNLTARYKISNKKRIASRLGYYTDPNEANVSTENKNGFQIIDLSINYDLDIHQNILWRNEVRSLYSKAAIFPTDTEEEKHLETFLTTNLTFNF